MAGSDPLMDSQKRRAYLEAMQIPDWRLRVAVGGSDSAGGATALPEAEAVASPQSPPPSVEESGISDAGSAASGPPSWLLEEPPLEDLEPVFADAEPVDEEPLRPPPVARLDWEGLRATVSRCEGCELHRSRKQAVFGVGDQKADLLVLGEAPGGEEDRKGEPFVGRAGQLLTAMLSAIGLRREQVYIANILKCRPPGNRDPRPQEVVSCAPYLQRQIELLAPKLILCVGRVAAQNLLKNEESVGRLRGREWRHGEIPVRVTYHPAYLLRTPAEKAKAWQDLQWVARKLGCPPAQAQ